MLERVGLGDYPQRSEPTGGFERCPPGDCTSTGDKVAT